MNNEIVLRRHVITLLPDTFLFSVSFLFLLTLEMARAHGVPAVEEVCAVAALFFSAIGMIDILKWYGFSVTIKPDCIEVRQFWLYKKELCHGSKNLRLSIRPVQSVWDSWLDKGTLIIYEPGGEAATLDNLSNFHRIIDSYKLA